MSVLKKLVWVFVALPLAVVVLALAVANRHDVQLVLDPTTAQDTPLSIEMPLFLLIFSALGAGVLLGGFATWLRQGKWRRRARERAGEAERLRREADRLTEQFDRAAQPRLAPADTQPMEPHEAA